MSNEPPFVSALYVERAGAYAGLVRDVLLEMARSARG